MLAWTATVRTSAEPLPHPPLVAPLIGHTRSRRSHNTPAACCAATPVPEETSAHSDLQKQKKGVTRPHLAPRSPHPQYHVASPRRPSEDRWAGGRAAAAHPAIEAVLQPEDVRSRKIVDVMGPAVMGRAVRLWVGLRSGWEGLRAAWRSPCGAGRPFVNFVPGAGAGERG